MISSLHSIYVICKKGCDEEEVAAIVPATSVEVDASVEGQIFNKGGCKSDEELCTIDEPVRNTIARDLKAIGFKCCHVLYPRQSKVLLKDWDLWGPLILCTLLAMLLQSPLGDGSGGASSSTLNNISSNDGGPQFAGVFVIYWVGASLVTINSKLLGGKISFFQSICVLGYCVCPLFLSLVICRIILAVTAEQTVTLFVIRLSAVAGGLAWSTVAAMAFLADSQQKDKKLLAMYPLFLFYAIVSWLIISHTHVV